VQKQGTHRALDDIRESVAELRFYREHIFLPAESAVVATPAHAPAPDAAQ
jgi:oligoribonuclease